MSKLLSDNLINALRKGGSYTFVVRVKQHITPSKILAFCTEDVEETWRNDTIELEEDWILDEDVQKQISDYMHENQIIKIMLNGNLVWHEPSCKSIILESHKMYRVD